MKYERLKHLDLFSGIGGFAIAVEAVWGKEVEHVFCDNEPFSQAVLKKHWPAARIYGDIRTLTADAESKQMGLARQSRQKSDASDSSRRGRKGRSIPVRSHGSQQAKANAHRPYILTGGFPCQPFSAAGRRGGTEDDRYLWPEMLRVIREFVPQWVIAENVAGLLTLDGGVVFQTVCTDLEREGYEVGAFVIPAAAVGAPHRRDRVWIVAHYTSDTTQRRREQGSENTTRIRKGESSLGQSKRRGSTDTHSNIADTNGTGLAGNGEGGTSVARHSGLPDRKGHTERTDGWEAHWPEVAARLCRMDDGVSRGLDRNKRLKALGNAIVPQVAIEIMRGISTIDR